MTAVPEFSVLALAPLGRPEDAALPTVATPPVEGGENDERIPVSHRRWTIDPVTGCWIWTGSFFASGYGQVHWDGRNRRAPRFVYERLVGPIPDGLQLDHLCRNPPCVNPNHLEPVTNRENTLRGVSPAAVNALKTHCKRGHPFDDANTYRYGGDGDRRCRACRNDASVRSRSRRRAEGLQR